VIQINVSKGNRYFKSFQARWTGRFSSFVNVADSSLLPFALSLSKGGMPSLRARPWFNAPKEIPLTDKLTTNGK